MFEFAYPAMLFFLLLIPLLWLYLAMFKRYPAIKVSTAAPFREGKKRKLRRLSAAQYIMLGWQQPPQWVLPVCLRRC